MTTPDSALRDQAILVLGMHRSGTSALTGSLVQLGCPVPANPIPHLTQNAKGFFESRPVARLDDRLLKSAGRSWSDWRPVPHAWFAAPGRTAQVEEGRAHLRAEFGQSRLLALKDPRICQLIPYWLRVLRDSGRAPLVLHIHRAPLEVARSLQGRNGFGREHGLLLWLSSVLQAEAGSRGTRRHFLSYDQLMQDPVATLVRAERALDLRFPRAPEAARAALEDFIAPDLRHHGAESPEALPPFFPAVHDILTRWAVSGEKSRDHAALDRIRGLVFPVLNRVAETERAPAACEAFFYLDPDGPWEGAAAPPGTESLELANAALRQALAEREARLERAGTAARTVRAAYKTRLAASRQAAAQDAAERRAVAREKTRLARRVDQLAGANADLRADLDRLDRQNAALRAAAAQSEAAHRAIADSTIWRTTAPLRRMIDRLRRGDG